MRIALSPRLAQFIRRENGVAAIEFALIAPLLVLFLLGTTQVTQSLWANGKIAQTTSVIGDLISQETALDTTTFDTIINAVPVLVEPLPVDMLQITVTSAIACHEDPDNITNSDPEYFIVWSRSRLFNSPFGIAGPVPGTPLSNPPEDLTIADGSYVIQTATKYTYRPPITREAGYQLQMEEIAYHQPRNQGPVSYDAMEGPNSDRNNDCDELMNR